VTAPEERLVADIPATLKVLVDEDDRTNKEIVIAALESELGVSADDSTAVVQRRIARLEDELEAEREEMERRRERVGSIRDDLDRAREVLAEQAAAEDEYGKRLDELLDTMEGDTAPDNVWPTHPTTTDIAADVDKSREEVHLDLEQRAAEQRRELTIASFKDGSRASVEDRETPIAEKWHDSSDAGADTGGDGA
jgi:chromosome segregation ATPase